MRTATGIQAQTPHENPNRISLSADARRTSHRWASPCTVSASSWPSSCTSTSCWTRPGDLLLPLSERCTLSPSYRTIKELLASRVVASASPVATCHARTASSSACLRGSDRSFACLSLHMHACPFIPRVPFHSPTIQRATHAHSQSQEQPAELVSRSRGTVLCAPCVQVP